MPPDPPRGQGPSGLGSQTLRICNTYFLTSNFYFKTYWKHWEYITTSSCFKCVFLKWLIPLDVAAWRLNLFLWALLSVASESVLNNFGSIQVEKGEIFWKETLKRLQKTGTILQLRNHIRTDLWTRYPFVRDVWILWSKHRRNFIDSASSQRSFKFCNFMLVYFWIQIISRALRRDLEGVV